MAGLSGCKTVLAIAENESPNWGAEVGYAYGRKMPIVGLARRDHQIPLILNGMMSETVRVDDLDLIADYLKPLEEALRRHLLDRG